MRAKGKRIVAILLAALLIVPIFGVTSTSNLLDTSASSTDTENEQSLITQVANVTGMDRDKIIQWRNNGLSWNQILESAPKNSQVMTSSDTTSSTSDYQEKLEKEGVSTDVIDQAKLKVTRLLYSLQEIETYANDETQVVSPSLDMAKSSEDSDQDKSIEECQQLLSSIDQDFLIYAIVKLQESLGSAEDVIDEYLYALQYDLDFEQAIDDLVSYEEQKQDKMSSIDPMEILTDEDIEELLLDLIQEENTNRQENSGLDMTKGLDPTQDQTSQDSLLPDTNPVTTPDAETSADVNPTLRVQEELEAMNPNN